MLMVSMSVSDIGLLTMATLMYAAEALTSGRTFGTFFCKLQSFALQVSGDSSIWAIAVVSIDRYDLNECLKCSNKLHAFGDVGSKANIDSYVRLYFDIQDGVPQFNNL